MIWLLVQAGWVAVKASRLLQIMLIVLPIGGYYGIKIKSSMHDRNVRAEATAMERQAAEIRRLTAQKAILATYAAAGMRRQAARDASIEAQRAEIADLAQLLEAQRDESARSNDPARPLFRADDPWMRQGGTVPRARGPAAGR